MYDPSVGRWLNEDPLGFAAGDANLYRYVGNNPTNATDPSGLQINPQVATPGNVHIVQQVLYPPRPPRPPFPAAGVPPTTYSNLGGGYFQHFWFAPSRPTMANAHPFAAGTAPTPIPAAAIAALPNGLPTCGGNSHQLFPATLAPGQFVGTHGCAGSIGLIIHSPGHGTAVFHFSTQDSGAPQTINQNSWPAGSHAIIIGGNSDHGSCSQMNQVINTLATNGITLDGIVNNGNGYLGADGNWHVATTPPYHDPR